MRFPLEVSSADALGLDPKPLTRLRELITAHVAEGRYPAAQIAVARHGKVGLVWTLGDARLDPQRVPARDDTLWLLYSSYCWADPDSGVSFAYLTNSRVPDPWHSARMDRVSNLIHAAIL